MLTRFCFFVSACFLDCDGDVVDFYKGRMGYAAWLSLLLLPPLLD